MRHLKIFFLLLITPFFLFGGASTKKPIHLRLILDSNNSAINKTCEHFCSEFKKLIRDEFEIVCTKKDDYISGWSVEEISQAVDDAMNDPGVDIVVGMGVVSSNEIIKRKKHSKPSFAPFVLDSKLQGLESLQETSGIDNLNYLTLPTNLERDFSIFHQLVPFNKLHILMNKYIQDAVPGLKMAFKEFARSANIEIDFIEVTDFVDINYFPKDVEAVYLLSMPQMSDVDLAALADELIKRKIPSFSLFSQRYLELGFLVSMSPDTDLPRLIRRLALNIHRTILGENPKDLPVLVSERNQLTINMKTVSLLGFSPPWNLLHTAVLMNCVTLDKDISLSLYDTVCLGLEKNLDLAVVRKTLDIGKMEIKKAYSALFPQVGIAGTYSRIDKDRARGSFGVYPEHALWGQAQLSQVLYSAEVFGDISVEKELQRAREKEYNISKRDIVLAVSQSYLNLLQSQTVENIHRKNLEKTRSHLKLAEERVKVGEARKSEVYRWESQYANDLSKVVESGYITKSSETCLKRLLNLPQDRKLRVENVELDESYWKIKRKWLENNVIDDKSLELFIDYSVYEGLCRSDEIKKIQKEINAQNEILGIAKKSLWTPDVYLEASVRDRNREWGAGRSLPAIYNRTDWSYTLNVSFPLFTGGYKLANKKQAMMRLKSLQLELDSQIEKEKEKIRISIYEAVGSYVLIGLANSSWDNAKKNFELVQEAYAKGTLPIVDLLDAQNQDLVADLIAADSIYNFLSDLMLYQRNINRFDFFVDDYESEKWVNQINEYFKRSQGSVK